LGALTGKVCGPRGGMKKGRSCLPFSGGNGALADEFQGCPASKLAGTL
jgi:hypothetical protein